MPTARQRQANRARGGCDACGTPVPPGTLRCDPCVQTARHAVKSLYHRRRARHECVQCGKPRVPKVRCAACRKYHREWQRRVGPRDSKEDQG